MVKNKIIICGISFVIVVLLLSNVFLYRKVEEKDYYLTQKNEETNALVDNFADEIYLLNIPDCQSESERKEALTKAIVYCENASHIASLSQDVKYNSYIERGLGKTELLLNYLLEDTNRLDDENVRTKFNDVLEAMELALFKSDTDSKVCEDFANLAEETYSSLKE